MTRAHIINGLLLLLLAATPYICDYIVTRQFEAIDAKEGN